MPLQSRSCIRGDDQSLIAVLRCPKPDDDLEVVWFEREHTDIPPIEVLSVVVIGVERHTIWLKNCLFNCGKLAIKLRMSMQNLLIPVPDIFSKHNRSTPLVDTLKKDVQEAVIPNTFLSIPTRGDEVSRQPCAVLANPLCLL